MTLKPTGPTHPSATRRIAILGQCPDRFDMGKGLPFSGWAAKQMWDSLKEADIHPSECWLGYVHPEPAPGGKPSLVRRDSPVLRTGTAEAIESLKAYRPTLVLALGTHAISALRASWSDAYTWRGSLFEATLPNGHKVKCLACPDPYTFDADDSQLFFWNFCVEKARAEAGSAELVLPSRDITICDTPDTALAAMRSMHGLRLGFDIEGYAVRDGLGCTSFALAPSAREAYVVPLRTQKGAPVMGDREPEVWQALRALADSLKGAGGAHASNAASLVKGADPDVPARQSAGLVLHNGLYDAFVLAYRHDIHIVDAIVDDTMILMWELFSEVDKGLADLSAAFTREPYWKFNRKSTDDAVAWRYNGTDACLTMEVCDALYARPELTPGQFRHYGFNMSLVPAILHMELRGFRFDDAGRERLYRRTLRNVHRLQAVLDRMTGHTGPTDPEGLMQALRALCVKNPRRYKMVTRVLKSGPRKGQEETVKVGWPAEITSIEDVREFSRSENRESVEAVAAIIGPDAQGVEKLSLSQRGALGQALGTSLNISSPAANDYLYGVAGLPKQYKKENGRLTDRLTHDSDALLSLYYQAQRTSALRAHEPMLRCWLRLASLTTELETLSKPADWDGRFRTSYNLVGTKTGRLSCSKSATGLGYNLQTVTKSHRHLFLADEGCEMAQFDLSGADGFTIAAHCLAVGDDTMWEDYRAGLKPAVAVMALLKFGPVANSWSRAEIKERVKPYLKGWEYMGCKRVIWGWCYLMGLSTMSRQLLSDSYAPGQALAYVSSEQCAAIQKACASRYPGVPKWQSATADLVLETGELPIPNGHVRRFLGRRIEWVEGGLGGGKRPQLKRTVHGDALADEPQEATTYATKMALWRLWYDPNNRTRWIEPLHTVHDSLVVQYKAYQRLAAQAAMADYFRNPFKIAGTTVTIPAAGETGTNWGMQA